MVAAGARCRYERRKALMLFRIAKAIFHERQHQQEAAAMNNNTIWDHLSPGAKDRNHSTQRTSCLLVLIVFVTWQETPEILGEALSLQSRLVQLVRESGLEEDAAGSEPLDWRAWIEAESARRVKLFAFCFLNVQSIAYNTPPILLSYEIKLQLPCLCQEWIAVNETEWVSVRQRMPKQKLFQDAMATLMRRSGDASCIEPTPSPVANYILLHGLLYIVGAAKPSNTQRRYRYHNGTERCIGVSALTLTHGALWIETRYKIYWLVLIVFFSKAALHGWTSGWQRAPESSLDPLNPNGPIPFTSTAFLGLAYCRIHVDLGPYRNLNTRDPQKIASVLSSSPDVPRSRSLLPALLHATHALSIPVKLGVDYVAQSQAFVWSIQHVLCAVEFAIVLNKWLYSVSQSHSTNPLNGMN
ncbi:hypothetical protein BO71DRAFT_65879 [Aspergillus ellipticus CBS 707.79]|uniref:Xylanolytic transcriptional activator regulatory domain-containing protein n=1 Tax=Aspergillus ellipticus CBS 707.79 TaxID=1448320 RepID=A0A319DVX0_9EURO|nr:hypothetical protein BO71DRAFT_65879 [Aspergillus ellipticus CBS 707.79]